MDVLEEPVLLDFRSEEDSPCRVALAEDAVTDGVDLVVRPVLGRLTTGGALTAGLATALAGTLATGLRGGWGAMNVSFPWLS